MHRRGPDHAAVRSWINPAGQHVSLLHTRLKIIDLDGRANQPFEWDQRWLAYNGELYNYVELRRELEHAGETFATTSDTEVFLRLLARHGWPSLDRCEGMWAFALYDETDGSLTLCRDRFGEKPLYFFRDESGLYFGSEVKFIRALAENRLQVNMDHLCRYLVNGYKALYKNGQTFFQGVEEVPRAHRLRIEAKGRLEVHRYWEPKIAQDESLTYEEAVAGARDRLVRSVGLRLRADVPLAFCMSGGVDSNSLIGIAKQVFGHEAHGFTVTNHDTRYEEQEMVDYAVSEMGVRHTSIPVRTTQFLPDLRKLVVGHDSPVATITYFAHWRLMQSVAEQGYRIAVSGTAADELFSGYYDHHLAYLYETRNDPVLHEASHRAWNEHVRPWVRNPYLGNADLFVENRAFRDHIYLNADEFSTWLTRPWNEPFAEEEYSPDLLRNRMLNEIFHEAVPVILHEDDLNAMYFSIENRSPFLDRDLFEFCFRIPTRHLIRNGYAKTVLRDAMRGIVPAAILDSRRKVGFNAPIFSFLNVGAPEVKAALLEPSPIFDLVRRDRIERLIEKPDLPNSESKFLFYFINSKMFLEEFDS
jgi:asparagine synthase (glutamine-hydrolysing)